MMTKTSIGAVIVAWLVMPAAVFGQEDAPQSRAALTSQDRVRWVVDGSVSPGALGVAALSASWQTAVASGSEWGGGWSGFEKRYAARVAQTTVSNSIEAGLGSLWGEDPRYRPSEQRRGIWTRTGHALKYVVLSERRDGRLRPAWSRFIAVPVTSVAENAWLPPGERTAKATAIRAGTGLIGRVASNLYREFRPETKRLIARAQSIAP
jgi:hypothetical protein